MKQSIWDVLINFINNNQNNNWNEIFQVLVIFLGVFWLAICIWVFIDARTRYDKWYVAFLITIFVLVFSIPALIMYVILRPEHTREEIALISKATSPFGQSIPVEIEEELLNSGKAFKMNFSLNFTPNLEGGQPKISFALESLNGLPLNESNTSRKTLAENVEVINSEQKEEVELEQTISNKDLKENEESKESEQLETQKSEGVKTMETEKTEENVKIEEKFEEKKQENKETESKVKNSIFKVLSNRFKNISGKVFSFPKRVIIKVKSIKLIDRQKLKLKIKLPDIKGKFVSVRKKIFPLKATNPTEVILPNNSSEFSSSEKLAKSKKKKKNRNRRR